MRKIDIAYWFFYGFFIVVIGVAIFFDKSLLVYTKPIVPLSLIVIYIRWSKKVNVLFILSMITIMITDIFVYINFVEYFRVIALLITVFYIFCVFLLLKFVSKQDLKLKQLISPPLFIGVMLIFYLIFSITQMVLPKMSDSIGYIISIVISMLSFSAIGFVIYIADRFEKSIYLFVATCCTLFVDALLAVNELLYYNRVFTVLINIAEIGGIYFFTKFLIETRDKNKNIEPQEDNYF